MEEPPTRPPEIDPPTAPMEIPNIEPPAAPVGQPID
jgi:hypothetical protein